MIFIYSQWLQFFLNHGVDLLHRAPEVGSLEAGGAVGVQKRMVIYAAVEVVALDLGALGRQR